VRRKRIDGEPTMIVRLPLLDAHRILGVRLHLLTDTVVPIDDLWPDGGAQLRESLYGVVDPFSRTAVVEQAIASRIAHVPHLESSRLVRCALRFLDGQCVAPTVNAWADGLGVGERRLHRAFHDVVGLTPKAFLRARRFKRALACARQGLPWSAVAIDAGYYDQAHMINEFQRLAHATPREMVGEFQHSATAP
jgi:AraC-like DNA-binding protein